MSTLSHVRSTLHRGSILFVGLLACALVLAGCDSNGGGGEEMDNPTIAELASNRGNLSTLASALQQADLAETLNNEDQSFTVFAPVNSAFGDIDADELTANSDLLEEVLTYHVVSGQAIRAEDIQDGQTVQTVEGGELEFSVDGNTVRVNSASVTTVNLEASNGVVHLVDGVLLETVDAVDRAVLTPQLETTAAAIDAAGLAGSDSPLRDGPLTIFAPVNGAFSGLEVDALTTDRTELLGRILQYHVISGQRLGAGDLSSGPSPATLEGGTIDIQVAEDGTVTLNGIPVSTTDIRTENAVIHLIDGVLLQRINAVERARITSNLSTLASAVGEAGLASDLQGEGPFTIFAPVDSAFANYNTEALTGTPSLLSRVLRYHVIAGQSLESGDLSSGESPQTIEGGTITIDVSNGGVTLNDRVTVTTTDIQVRNGVIHLLDDVLLRRTNAVQRALVTPEFSILADLVQQAGLADALGQEDEAFTVFAPTNDAFLAALDENDNGQIDDNEVPSNAQSLLQYHVGDGVFYANDEPTAPSGIQIPQGVTPVPTLEGSEIAVERDGDTITLNPNNEASSVIAPDVDVTNGVVHGIDTVLQIPAN